MEVGVEAGHRMDVADWHFDPRRQRLELLGGQVAEISLYSSQLLKHGARDSVVSQVDSSRQKNRRARIL